MARRRAPLPGSVEWMAIQARGAGMSYGQYVAQMDQLPAPPHQDPEQLDKRIRAKRRKHIRQEKQQLDKQLQRAREEWQSTLRQARKQQGLSRQQAAWALAVSETTVRNWERGETRPRQWILPSLARIYGLDYTRINTAYLNAWKDRLP